MKINKWFILILLLLVGCVVAEDTTPTAVLTSPVDILPSDLQEVIGRDAEMLAEEFGISLDEAYHRILMMEASGDLNARLEREQADTFAGLWILHEPTFQVIAAFTENGEKTIQPYLENSPLAEVIELRTAQVTLAYLTATEVETHKVVDNLGLGMLAYTTVNIPDNQVEIHGIDPILLDQKLSESGLQLPAHVEVIPQKLKEGVIPANVTPAPGIHFPQLISPPGIVYSLGVDGTLALQDNCLRLMRQVDGEGDLLIWHPGYYLSENAGVYEVLDGNGVTVARIGEISCFSPAGGEMTPQVEKLLREPLPEACGGPYFFVGDVRLSYPPPAEPNMVSVDLVPSGKEPFYFIQKKPPLDAWLGDPMVFTGKLIHVENSRCIRIQAERAGTYEDGLLFWPENYTFREENGEVAILDDIGQVIAHVGDEVHLKGWSILETGEIRELLYSELPCDCAGGSYWVVEGDEKED